jgi:formylglycine-generating enzyme required for sulfatase activity
MASRYTELASNMPGALGDRRVPGRWSAEIEFAGIAAQKAGPIKENIVPLSDSELMSPVDLSAPSCDTGGLDDGHDPVIFGYEILCEIATGGQATAYEAIQLATGQHVAIKVLTGGQFAAVRHRARFDQEAQLLVKLNHPNIVGIVDRGRTADGSFFIATRFIAGHSLDDYWTHCVGDGGEDTKRLLRIFVKLLDAISTAHRQNVVHRDIKPSNIRVDERGEPHLLDFGLARTLQESEKEVPAFRIKTMSGEIVGSLPWASPEQVSGKSVDGRSDLYAIGVMLYHALSGQFPYSTDCPMRDLINEIAQIVPRPPLCQRNARKIPSSQVMDAIVMKALAKRPQDRYCNAEEMALDITRYLDGRRTIARTVCRRRQTFTIAAIVAAIAFGVFAAHVVRSAPPSPPSNVVELPTYSNTLGLHFLRVPAGTFLMGSAPLEEGRKEDEVQHSVTLTHPFWLSTTEVTQHQYSIVMGGPKVKNEAGDIAVSGVNWKDANDFCARLSLKEGANYRLPREAEWEYACRAGTRGPFGGTGRLGDIGWSQENSHDRRHPVASLSPNGFGFFDMHGGVAEWCSDEYQEFNDRPQIDPQGPTNRSIAHIVRGGSFKRQIEDCRSACREAFPSFYAAPDIGFRVVFEPPIPRP